MNITPVILCGGSGTRLWPLSRSGFPKQFIALSGEQSLFQQAVQRVQDLAQEGFDIGDALIVTNEEHRFLALDQLKDMPAVNAQLILEPAPRNTAPALTLAALQAVAHNQDAIMVVSPAELNDKLRTVIVAPMTSKGFAAPFRVPLTHAGTKGQIVLDLLRTVDKVRLVKKLGAVSAKTLSTVLVTLQEVFAE